jgi:L-2-hydroxyglutarate oxidase LhgO
MEQVDAVVIGAGVVGLAVAREVAMAGHETILLEREDSFGTITSARNSEVIHAGIYYPKGSLKAQLCVKGNRLLYDYCESHQVPTHACGKLIVATHERQLPALEGILAHAQANGVRDIHRISGEQAQQLEPHLHCVAALWSKSTGIVDSHRYMLALLGDFEKAGGMIAYRSSLLSARAMGDHAQHGFELEVGGDEGSTLRTTYLINCAGLSAPSVASLIDGMPVSSIPRAYFAKGNYFSLSGSSPFSRLIYPMPEPGGLGVHLTLDMGGQAKFGPDVEWLDITAEHEIDYTVDGARGEKFYAAIRQYWPDLKQGAL